MVVNDTFPGTLYAAADAKQIWYDTVELPKLLEEYRSFHSVVSNLYNILEKKALIQPDPYKIDKKISDISIPDETQFIDSERSMVIGARLSDFESILDFVCNIFKFSVATLTLERIKTLLALNNYFQWTSMVPTSLKSNTRGLAEIIASLKVGSDTLTNGMVTDCVNHSSKCVGVINKILKNLTEFQKELYKIEIRKTVLVHPSFSTEKAANSLIEANFQIRKTFSLVCVRKPFYAELADELAQEEFGPDKENHRKEVLSKLTVLEQKEEKKQNSVNTHQMLLDAIKSLAAMTPQLELIYSKVDENHRVLESEHQGFWDKFLTLLRQAFNQPEKPIEYNITVVEPLTQTRKVELLIYQDFMRDINKKIRTYSSFAVKSQSGYQKLDLQEDSSLEDYLNKQINECQKLLTLLVALDEFFKNAPRIENRNRIKGLKMELTAFKNALVKTKQRKTEYSSYIEEEIQLKKLGITND